MDLPGALATVSTAVGILKQLNEIDARVDEAAFKLRIAEITSVLADTKLRLIDAGDELRAKEEEIKALKSALTFKADRTTWLKGFTYECKEDGSPKGVPFCPVCEAGGVMLRLVRYIHDAGMPWKCARCKADYQMVSTFPE